MLKIEGIFDTRTSGYLSCVSTRSRYPPRIKAEAALHEADGTIAQIMSSKRVGDALQKAFSDRAIGFALIATIQRTQHQGKRRRCAGGVGRGGRENGCSTHARAIGQPALSSNDGSSGRADRCDAPATGSFFIQTRCVVSPNRSTACQPSVFCATPWSIVPNPERSVELTFANEAPTDKTVGRTSGAQNTIC
jgi:hypothetical protein